MREIVQINIGGAGLKIGQSIWDQILNENMVEVDEKNQLFSTLAPIMHESQTLFSPRTIFIDSDPYSIFSLLNGKYRNFFDSESLVFGKEDAANLFARGRYIIGREYCDSMMDCVRRQVEKCEGIDSIMMNFHQSGGTGSGLTSYLAQQLRQEYGEKMPLIGNAVMIDNKRSSIIVDPYNSTLQIQALIEYFTSISIVTNEGIERLCNTNLKKENPGLPEFNKIISKLITSQLGINLYPQKYSQQSRLSSALLLMQPYPRIHFNLVSYTPFTYGNFGQTTSIETMMRETFNCKSFLSDASWGVNLQQQEKLHLISSMLLSRSAPGTNSDFEIQNTYSKCIKRKEKMFTDFTNKGLIVQNIQPLGNKGGMSEFITLHNSCKIECLFQYIGRKFDGLYSRRPFVHYYVGEGLAEEEFIEAREDLAALEKDYEVPELEFFEGEEE